MQYFLTVSRDSLSLLAFIVCYNARCSHARPAPSEYGRNSLHLYKAGAEVPLRIMASGISLSSERQASTRETGCGTAQVPYRCLCTWLFLAWT